MKKTINKQFPLEGILQNDYLKHVDGWDKEDHPGMKHFRQKAFDFFKENGFPDTRMEKWRSTDLSGVYEENLTVIHKAIPYEKEVNEIFRCEVHGFQTKVISMLNGSFYSPAEERLTVSEEGVIMGSLREAWQKYPDLVEPYYGTISGYEEDGFKAINAAMARDGVFVYVPDGVEVKNTVQLIKILNQPNILVNTRNLIVLGKQAKLTFLHCDDSVNHHAGLTNTVNEIYLHESAQLELYKLQNLNDESVLLNQSYIHQDANSHLKVNIQTLNGGLVRNEINNFLNGQGAESEITGLYLMDKQQHIDNQILVKHNAPHCDSQQLFKGIMDDKATGVFNGFIYVARDAQKTNAFQRNSNVLLKTTAHIDTQPQLEIYADDVKCSHGATVGQLDNEGMFYLMQRGIPFEDARMLLLYAYADDVISKISIDALRISIEDMVKRRLRGELSICDRCVLHCSNPDQPVTFDIDLSKI